MLKDLYTIQTALNDAIGWPSDYEDLQQLHMRNAQGFNRTALVTELGEALQAMKPLWAWWTKPGDAPYDPQAVADELIDATFFLLTHFDLLQHSAYHEARFKGMLPVVFLPDDTEARRNILGASFDVFEFENLVQDEVHIGSVNEIREMGYDTEFMLPVLVRSMMNASSGPDFTTEQIFSVIVRLFGTWHLLGFSWEDLWRQYHAKALVNLTRWHDSGSLVIDEEAYEELRHRVALSHDAPLPIPTQADVDAHREAERVRVQGTQEVTRREDPFQVVGDDGAPLLN